MDNPELGRKVLDYITEHPQEFNMEAWADTDTACGTTACLAGWAMLLSGYKLGDDDNSFYRPDGALVYSEGDEGAALLGLTEDERYPKDHVNGLFVMGEADAIERFRSIVETSETAKAATA